jgi:hypothetical protein
MPKSAPAWPRPCVSDIVTKVDRCRLLRIVNSRFINATADWGSDSRNGGAAVVAASLNISFRAQLVVPEQRQLYDYWVDKAAGREMPERADVHPGHFARLLPNISLIDVNAESGACRVRLAGTRLREVYDREITGLSVSDLDWGDKRDYWLAAYQRSIDEGKPAQGVVRGPCVNKEHLVQYWLKLPLQKAEAGRVCMLLCLDIFHPAGEEEEGLAMAVAT